MDKLTVWTDNLRIAKREQTDLQEAITVGDKSPKNKEKKKPKGQKKGAKASASAKK